MIDSAVPAAGATTTDQPQAPAVPVPDPIRPALPADAEHIAQAAELLRQGQLVAFPTETVYGLGADAANAQAVAHIFKVKRRPQNHPLIVHLPDASHMARWASEIPDEAKKLAARFWPGPLTLVLKRAPGVSDAVTGGQDTVGLRVPAHPAAQALLAAFAGDDDGQRLIGLAAPSANRFGRISPTTAEHVRADLGNDVDMILDGGACEFGIESTIIDLSRGAPFMLRPGRILAQDITAAIGMAPLAPDAEAPRASGTLEVHYAPRAKLRLVRRTAILEALAAHKGQRLAVLALEVTVPRLAQQQIIVVPALAAAYAHALYANLRALDATGADVILVELPPDTPAWAGVLDRLRRAAAAST